MHKCWRTYTDRPKDAKYTIHHAGGSTAVTVNQEINDAVWVPLGVYAMAPSSNHRVVLDNFAEASQYVIADAVRFVRDPDAEPPVIVNDTQASFVGSWTNWTTPIPAWASDTRYHAAGSGSNTATWTPTLPATANYKVYAWWYAAANRATNAPYTIHHSGGSSTVTVDQVQNGSRWNLLGTYAMAPGSNHRVVLTDNANGYVMADAVKFELDDTAAGDIVVDNTDNEASKTGTWLDKTWTGGGTFWGSNFRRTDDVGQGATHTWTPAIPVAGRYRVYARWAANGGYAPDAPFTVYHSGGSTTVDKDQRVGGGQWNLLGEYDMAPGQSHRVVLTDDAAAVVVADAIRLVHVGDTKRVAADAVKFVANDAEDVLYVHADHLGTPQKMTSSSGAIVWDAAYTPFGLEDSITGSEANDNRFPGQRFDAETALHYNYFRDYDPTVGRYIQSDPIGLAGGLNTYGYVGGNPIRFIDPSGLICIYSQSDGDLLCTHGDTFDPDNTYVNTHGYSGTGDGRDNPDMQHVPNVGPIPRGCWTVTEVDDSKGPHTLHLEPWPGNSVYDTNRQPKSFRIHGDSRDPAQYGDASEGCPIIKPKPRKKIAVGETVCVIR